ncbi:cupin domain-containing protein [Gluconacetobacter asukensis]|uniref:Cupin domain-containing protein n=1 Tax=Gluconacetobacter asukensis TaxID=1017181 RepID=A0A7W4P1C8_9PROT|nr:cupin domain-containing protein [Gluconacetobacter asukensis]MBB2173817.1 cupin domain-containing protein [Gluconacetobacter asukensis]
MTEKAPTIVNMHTAPEIAADVPAAWTHFRRALTPAMRSAGPGRFGMGRLGMGAVRVPPGYSACPAHTHLQADEIFVVLEGHGLFRYGDRVHGIHPGDCISCPADTGIAHQIANPATPDGRGDLVYLAIGAEPPADVCTYPDSGSLVIDGLDRRGFLREADYYEGQPQPTPLLTCGRDAPV